MEPQSDCSPGQDGLSESYSVNGSMGVVGLTPTDSKQRSPASPSSYHRHEKRPSIVRRPLLHPTMYNRAMNGDDASTDQCESCGTAPRAAPNPTVPDVNLARSGMFFRQKLYSRLVEPGDLSMRIPDHVLPSSMFSILPTEPEAQQSSIVTIFAIWNTMMGTSLLSMPWGIGQSGFIFGIIIIVLTGLLAFYTAFRVLKSKEYLDAPVFEFSDVAKYYFGTIGEWTALVFGLLAFVGGMIVYWVLMTNFLYMTGVFAYNEANHVQTDNVTQVLCANAPHVVNNSNFGAHFDTNSTNSNFDKYWNATKTAPLYLIVIIFPLMNFKSPTFFTKFNCLGTASVLYLSIIVVVKAVHWGVNMDLANVGTTNIKITFPALTGMLSLAFFLHNAVITILRNNKQQENNVRDLSIGYLLVMVTYMFVGILFYVSFPLPKDCISSNLLNNLPSDDPLAVGARAFMLFQMITVFPLLAYIFRVQLLHAAFGSVWPGVFHVLILNCFLVTMCVLIAVFYPHIGDIIRYSGSLCGLVYIFVLPVCVYMMAMYRRGSLTPVSIVGHSLIICIGVANFISQFLITPSK